MQAFPTARDVSLSLWQSAVATVARRRSGLPRSASQAELLLADPQGPVNQSDPMVAATSEYVAGIQAGGPPSETGHPAAIAASLSSAFDATAEVSGGLAPAEQSALYHQLAEANATGSGAKQAAAVKSIRQFGPLDAGWIASVAQYVWYYRVRGKEPAYRSWKTDGKGSLSYSVIDWKIPANGSVAIIADWGTGQSDAIAVLRSAASHDPDAIIHLGDIYYSGTEEECTAHVLQPVYQYAVKSTGERIPVFCLAGNHDYYSGGDGFLTMIDRINNHDGRLHQPASYFSLRTNDGAWQFLAMDTGFFDHDVLAGASPGGYAAYLRDDEIEWHRDKMESFGGATILLSHHQLCSANDPIGSPKGSSDPSYSDRLLRLFTPYVDRIAAWYWGHEHSLVLYEPFGSVLYPRCVGHSAIPVSADHPLYEAKYNVAFNEVRLGAHGGWYDHGYELLKLNGAERAITAEYYTLECGRDPGRTALLYREELAWPLPILDT
jgi:hypothetical protein